MMTPNTQLPFADFSAAQKSPRGVGYSPKSPREGKSPRESGKSPRDSGKRRDSLGKSPRKESERKVHREEHATIGLEDHNRGALNPLIPTVTHQAPLHQEPLENNPVPSFVIKPLVIPKTLEVQEEEEQQPGNSPRSPRTWQSEMDDEEKRRQLKSDAIQGRNQADICDDLVYFLDRVEHTQKTGNASQNIKARLQVSYLQNLLKKDENDLLHILMPVIESFEATSFQVAIAHSNLSYCALHHKNYSGAEYWANKGIETHGKGTYFLWENLSAAYKQQGKTDDAQHAARRAQQLRKADQENKNDVIHWVGKRLSPRKSRDFNIV